MVCDQRQRPDCYNPFQSRIFRFPSHAKSTRLHVREDIFHHFAKVCSTQRVVVQIVTEAPERHYKINVSKNGEFECEVIS